MFNYSIQQVRLKRNENISHQKVIKNYKMTSIRLVVFLLEKTSSTAVESYALTEKSEFAPIQEPEQEADIEKDKPIGWQIIIIIIIIIRGLNLGRRQSIEWGVFIP